MQAAFGSQRSAVRTALTTAQASPLGRQLFFTLAQVHQEFQDRMQRALRQVDLDIRQYTTLAYIAEGHTPTQLELAQILHLDPSQVVTLTKGLAARELIVRQIVPEDRRARAVVITTQGKQVYQQAAHMIARVEEALTASLSRRDHSALQNLLARTLPLS